MTRTGDELSLLISFYTIKSRFQQESGISFYINAIHHRTSLAFSTSVRWQLASESAADTLRSAATVWYTEVLSWLA
jgi:hypothetical protein